MMQRLTTILFIVVLLQAGWIAKLMKDRKLGSGNRIQKEVLNPDEAKVEIAKIKKELETSLGNNLIVGNVEPIKGTNDFYKAKVGMQNILIDRRGELMVANNYLIDIKNKINLSTGEEILVTPTFIHPSKSMGLKRIANPMGGMAMPHEMMKPAQVEEKTHEPAQAPAKN